MIERNTVFVLGAGAHCSYGFPSGVELIGKIVKRVERSASSDDRNDLRIMRQYRLPESNGVTSRKCMEFAEALSNSGHASIDAFINSNRHIEGFSIIGKAAIAQVLLEYEARERFATDDDWLGYVFRIMLEGVSTPDQFLDRNKVGFVTYNYDRFLESWLHTKIKFSFGIDDKLAHDVLRRIPIHHVYGSLGSPPGDGLHYDHPWVRAVSGIRTIYDTEHDLTVLDAAKSLLNEADAICLLGFGFHQENISLLDLKPISDKCPGVVAASRYEIRDMEWDRLMRAFSMRIIKSQYNLKCLESLRNLPVF